MTDEEARALHKRSETFGLLTSFRDPAYCFMRGYLEAVEVERARSGKLIEVLKSAYLSSDPVRRYTNVSQAIAEYEATDGNGRPSQETNHETAP